MKTSLRLLSILLFVGLQPGCTRVGPVATPAASSITDPVALLRADLDGIFSDQRFQQAQLGVKVLSLDRSETLYEKNSQRLLIPASSNKIIAAAVALLRLGPDYRFETRVSTDGQVENGTLKGNLIVAGSGDPSNSAIFQSGDPFAVFRQWAARLKERNIQAISGDILGDESAFEEPEFGLGWEWDDLIHAYAAPVSALQFNDNTLELEIRPGTADGNPAAIRVYPLENYSKICSRIVTGPQGTPADIRIRWGYSGETIEVSGTVPAKGFAVLRTLAVRRPTFYYLSALKYALSREGIDADSCGTRKTKGSCSLGLTLLWSHASPELSEILRPVLKNSQNLYSESLVRALGLTLTGKGTFDGGKEIIEETLAQMGIEEGSYSFADGSGLSRRNLESAEVLITLLSYMYRDRSFRYFYNALAVAGADGTLASRMKGTKAENNVRAKTGTMTNVSSISGYVRTADGEMLAFSIAANNFLAPKESVESMQDRALGRLADFSRKGDSE